jgi:hypothetical protein
MSGSSRERGSNLPGFRDAQLTFAAHIRNPQVNPAPADVEPRRMKIYLDLFYNNIEAFLASGFPVLKKVLRDERWHALVREFIHLHPSESPYFLEISQEFLSFLGDRPTGVEPPFLLELAHYEWVELALGVDERELPQTGFDPTGDLLTGEVVLSPLIWCLAYEWPVHEIGPDHLPSAPPAASTELIVYRQRDDRVRFMRVNAVTLRLVEHLGAGVAGAAALDRLASELPGVDASSVYEQGLATMERLRDAQIILGSRTAGERHETLK